MGKQYLTEHAIIFLEKSSGLSWNYPHGAAGCSMVLQAVTWYWKLLHDIAGCYMVLQAVSAHSGAR